MTKGLLVFARNNSEVDYVKQASFLARRAKQYLDLPTSIVTDSKDYDLSAFDSVIIESNNKTSNTKMFYDGETLKDKLEWKNSLRTLAYDLSPYDDTLVLDSDIVICNKTFLQCFERNEDFQIYKESTDLVNRPVLPEFKKLSDPSIDFYWATCVFFRKTQANKIFFDLLQHIERNWHHYIKSHSILSSNFRNDFVFSMGIHIMNGFQPGSFAHDMPGKLYHITDKSKLLKIEGESLLLLLENNTVCRINDVNLHAMNKFSLNRCIDEQ